MEKITWKGKEVRAYTWEEWRSIQIKEIPKAGIIKAKSKSKRS